MTTIAYDYRNQMVGYVDPSTGVMAAYAYDALGRRISKIVDLGPSHVEPRYFCDG